MRPAFAPLCLALAAAAQSAVAQPTSSTLDKVEVVGSRVSRVDTETALPVEIIRREDI